MVRWWTNKYGTVPIADCRLPILSSFLSSSVLGFARRAYQWSLWYSKHFFTTKYSSYFFYENVDVDVGAAVVAGTLLCRNE
jgi:hypothetical protein